MTRVLARCPDSGNLILTGMDWSEEGPSLTSKQIDVFCPDCGWIHRLRPFLESSPEGLRALPNLGDAATA